MRQSLYIDTSVFGGYFDDEFCKHTLPLFDRIARGEFVVLFSSVTQEEIENAPDRVKNLVTKLEVENTIFWMLQKRLLT